MSSVLKKGGSSLTNSTSRILSDARPRRSARSLASSITRRHPGAVVVGARGMAVAVVVGAHHQRLGTCGGGGGLDHHLDVADLPARRGEGLPVDRVAHPRQGGLDVQRGPLQLVRVADVVGPARDRPHVCPAASRRADLLGRQRRQRARMGTARHGRHPEHARHGQGDQQQTEGAKHPQHGPSSCRSHPSPTSAPASFLPASGHPPAARDHQGGRGRAWAGRARGSREADEPTRPFQT